uniref:cellulase n=1 Tax=Timema shepardi TaxID=629360 RepID=A0A7R9G1B3_TIMSH|nr:unnamed protein product [Timema shepardi]
MHVMILLLLRRKTITEPLNKIVSIVPARSEPEKIVTSRSELETDQESDQVEGEKSSLHRSLYKHLSDTSLQTPRACSDNTYGVRYYGQMTMLEYTRILVDYGDGNYGDELTWAAAWLYKATSESQYLDEAEHNYMKFRLKERPNEFFYNKKVAGVQGCGSRTLEEKDGKGVDVLGSESF